MPKLKEPVARRVGKPAHNRYAQHADDYFRAGFTPIAVKGKQSPFKGTTVYRGEVTPEADSAMRRSTWHDNVALRHNEDTIAIDVDQGDGKRGAETIAALEAALGLLPPTYSSTARGQGYPRRQLFFRKNANATLISTLTPGLIIAGQTLKTGDIEIPQRRHRYSVVWPSIHPDTGKTYTLYDLDGKPMNKPPHLSELPFLPEAWEKGLAEDAARAPGAQGSSGKLNLEQLLAEPPKRGTGRTNIWLTQVCGHYARQLRQDRAAYLHRCQEAIALVDPDYEEAEKTIQSVWERDQHNHAAEQSLRSSTSHSEGRVSLDDSLITEFVATKLRPTYCWASGLGWLHFDGRRWHEISDAALIEATRRILKDQYHYEIEHETDLKRLSKFAALLTSGKIRAVVSLVRGILERRAADFDRQPALLNVGNGVVDLHTGELKAHDPEYFFTKVTDVNYIAGAASQGWELALAAVPPETVDWLQVRFGQAATGYPTSDDKLPIMQGSGANGKSTVIDSITGALGEHAVIVPEKLLTANNNDHPTELTTLMGARLAIIEELPEGARFTVKRLKDILGTKRITARKIQRDNVTWDASHSLVVTTNYRPRVDATDHGTWRRLTLVRFPYTFRTGARSEGLTRQSDPGLRERLRAGEQGQHEAVLAWVVEGARRWFERGKQFPPTPGTVERDTLDWREDTDLVLGYVGEHLRFDADSVVLSTDLFEHFNTWLRGRGHAEWGDTTLTRRFGEHTLLTDHGVSKRRTRNLSGLSRPAVRASGEVPKQANVWAGIAFKDPDEEP